MAEWSVALGDPAAVNLYSYKLFRQSIQKTLAWRLCNISTSADSPENIVQMLDDTSKERGANITYDLIMKLSGRGVSGDNELAGTSEALTIWTASITIDQRRHSVEIKGAVSQQRVPFKMRDQAKDGLANWNAERLDFDVLNQATGNTYQADTIYSGMQATIAPDATSMVYAHTGGVVGGASRTSEATLASGDCFDISLLYDLSLLAETRTYPMKPINIKGVELNGVVILHPLQWRSMKTRAAANQWADWEKAAMQGGQITRNPIFTGAGTVLADGWLIHKDVRVPYGDGTEATSFNPLGAPVVGTTHVARAAVLGAQALSMATGRAQAGQLQKYKWVEELMDGNNKLRVSTALMFGLKKNVFNSKDFACLTLSTYEVQ